MVRMSETTTVGVLGLGIMGSAIAANLTSAGFSVVGFDPDCGRRDEMAAKGIAIAADAAEAIRRSETLLSSLPNEAALEQTVAAILSSGASGRTLVEMSTLAIGPKVAAAEALAAAGHVFLDCPLSGTGAQARNRDLTVYASGDSAAIARLAPVFEGFAKSFFDLGVVGNGSRMKYVANLLVCIHNLAAAEALVLAMKAGLDPSKVIEVVRLGAGGSRMLEVRGPMMAADTYEPVTAGFPMYFKDLDIICDFAMKLGAPTPLLSATLPYYVAAGNAYPQSDVAAICRVLETMADVKRETL
jgi:3-hydroxyisobutyrate dehydrogenase-like beta-hydroxyacid dehydrogenase